MSHGVARERPGESLLQAAFRCRPARPATRRRCLNIMDCAARPTPPNVERFRAAAIARRHAPQWCCEMASWR